MNSKSILNSILSIIIALLFGIVFIFVLSKEPLKAISSFFTVSLSNSYFFGNMLTGAIPLMLTGLASAISFKASVFNLGLEGQLYLGAIVGTYSALILGNSPSLLVIIISILLAFLFSGFLAMISAYLKIKFFINEMISSLLISYSIIIIIDYFLENYLIDRGSGLVATSYILEKNTLFKIFPPSNLHSGIFIAFSILILFSIFYSKSKVGFQINTMGKNYIFAKYAGIRTDKLVFLSFLLSGGMCGLAGIIDILGNHERMIRGFSIGLGWNGITIALLARGNPLLIAIFAIFFSFLESGAINASIFSDITPEISKIIQAIIFFLVTTRSLQTIIQVRFIFEKKKGKNIQNA